MNTAAPKKIDVLTFDFKNVDFDSFTEIELTMDLGDLVMLDQTNDTFDDLIKNEAYKKGNLYYLTKIRYMLKESGVLKLVNTYSGIKDAGYSNRLDMLLNKAGFINIEYPESGESSSVRCIKRPAESLDIGYGLTLREVYYPDEIYRCHLYAKEFYFYKDFNYDLDVVKQFDLNCDHFAVFDEDDEIYSLARIVLRVPGYYCPFMYATIAGDDGRHFRVEGKDDRIGEVMAIYSAGKRGVVAFKRMMEFLTQYGTDIAHFDSVWTTYDDEDAYTGMYYRNKFLMEDTGVKLKYSDFGGSWNLLVTRKIAELKALHNHIFRQGKE